MSDTPMTREPSDDDMRLVEEAVAGYAVVLLDRGDLASAAWERVKSRIAESRTEMERLEGERDAAATFAQNVDDLRVARIAELQATVERLEGERDRWQADSDLGNDLQRRDEARIEELEARIAELETLIVSGDTEDLSAARYTILKRERARAALPDTEGPNDE